MILDHLKHLAGSKLNLQKAQKAFLGSLKKTYPNLETEDIEAWFQKVDDELNYLLSSTVRIKSGRVVIEMSKKPYYNTLVLTRQPGLKFPYHSFAALNFANVRTVKENGDLISSISWNPDLRTIPLSQLQGHSLIVEERFQKFLELLRVFVQIRNEYCWRSKHSYNQNTLDQNSLGRFRFEGGNIDVWNINFGIRLSKDKGGYFFDSSSLHEFHDKDEESDPVALTCLVNLYPHIHEMLMEAEVRKGMAIAKARSLYQNLRNENKRFRILERLTQ